MNKQTDFERVMASAIKSGRDMSVVQDPMGKVVHWHECGPHMVYDHSGKHIETRAKTG